jgi:hypothetical protein
MEHGKKLERRARSNSLPFGSGGLRLFYSCKVGKGLALRSRNKQKKKKEKRGLGRCFCKTETNLYTSYSKLSEVKLITIGLASPERIKQWAEKTLPNGKILGEVINANTLHHKTFKPQKGGLFCERIFGPLKDFECACGKPLKFKKESDRYKFSWRKSIGLMECGNLETTSAALNRHGKDGKDWKDGKDSNNCKDGKDDKDGKNFTVLLKNARSHNSPNNHNSHNSHNSSANNNFPFSMDCLYGEGSGFPEEKAASKQEN